MDRVKMPRKDRAKQFAPFDALKGLHDALRLKEYKHEKVAKGEMSEDDAKAISDVLTKIIVFNDLNIHLLNKILSQ